MKTAAQLRVMLGEQVDFLESSAEGYDAGRLHEAKRLATTIRVLVHDTGSSQSLLSHLDVKNRLVFMDTAGDLNLANLASLAPFLIYRATVGEGGRLTGTYEPMLGDGPPFPGMPRGVGFDKWWTMLVVRDAAGEIFTRKELVLFLANKAGGAHVDSKVQARIDALARSETLGFSVFDVDGERPVEEDPILPCVRQIAYELLETLRCCQWIPGREPST